MKLRRQLKYHRLAKPKLRQTWNKYNLYNMTRLLPKIDPGNDTFFQQKWKAKAMTRAYHGEHVSEHRWERLFSRRLLSVVPMDPEYMSKTDGSTEVSGRGSGLQKRTAAAIGSKRRTELKMGLDMLTGRGDSSRKYTPYMNMTFAPLERRLDTAIFRAMFATSSRQARNFVIHGHVKVNGIKVDKPTYMLNPGDMFQVDPEMVMYATGVHKGQPGVQPSQKTTENSFENDVEAEATDDGDATDGILDLPTSSVGMVENGAAIAKQGIDRDGIGISSEEQAKEQQKKLKSMMTEAMQVLEIGKDGMNAAAKRRLRAWRSAAKDMLAKSKRDLKKKTLTDTEVIVELNQFLKDTSIEGIKSGAVDAKLAEAEKESDETEEQKGEVEERSEQSAEANTEPLHANQIELMIGDKKQATKSTSVDAELGTLTDEQIKSLGKMLLQESGAEDGGKLTDSGTKRKPYANPWRARPYMAAFAFIPRYLEVNPFICAAVYLRHPVARPGRAEVPTPFPEFVSSLAFNYYLRRS